MVHHEPPDFEIRNHSPVIPDTLTSGNFQMANSRDELMVYEGNLLTQKITWPEDVRPREGQVHYYADGTWDKRVLMIGQSRLDANTFNGVSGTCFLSPRIVPRRCMSSVLAAQNPRSLSTSMNLQAPLWRMH